MQCNHSSISVPPGSPTGSYSCKQYYLPDANQGPPATMVVSVGGEHCRRDRELENQLAPPAAARTLLHAHYCRKTPTKQVALTTAPLTSYTV